MSDQGHDGEPHSSIQLLPTSASRSIFGLSCLLPVLATIAVVCRFAARRMKKVRPGADDWTIVLGVPVLYALCVISILLAVKGGAGHHIDTLTQQTITMHGKLLVGERVLFAICLGITKSSVCLLLARVFHVSKFRFAAYGVMGISIVWAIAAMIVALAICKPIAYSWDKQNVHGSCGNENKAFIAVAALDIAVDVALIILPLPMVWRLKLRLAHKIALTVLFALGLFEIAAAIHRIDGITMIDPAGDYTYQQYLNVFWSAMECGVAVIVACAGTLRPIFDKMFSSFRTTRSKPYSTSRNYTNLDRDTLALHPHSKSGGESHQNSHTSRVVVNDDESQELDVIQQPSKVYGAGVHRDHEIENRDLSTHVTSYV